MKLSERLAKDIDQLKDLPDRKSRIRFIYDYYRIPILVIIIFMILTVFSLSNSLRHNKSDMYVVALNSDYAIRQCDSGIFDEVLKCSEFPMKGHVDVNERLSLGFENSESSDIETLQVLSALFMMGDLDLYIAPREHFDYFADQKAFCDLETLLDSNILKKNEADLYSCNGKDGNQTVAGIVLHDGSLIHQAGYYHDDVVIGIAVNAFNMDAAVSFLNELLK